MEKILAYATTAKQTYTQVIPVVACQDESQILEIMGLCGTARALTYNKLGSLQGWGLNWKKADKIVRTIMTPEQIGLPSKLWEWAVNDTIKAITAQQEAAKVFIIREIYGKTSDKSERKRLLELLKTDPRADPWLHRIFRKQYQRGHTFVRNQIVYQNNGYKCKRLTRNTVELQVAGLNRGKRVSLKLKCRHVLKGQIRLIQNGQGRLEVHTIRTKAIPAVEKPVKTIGLDKGYTEAFYLSTGETVGEGLGELLSRKSLRHGRTNRNRYRLFQHAQRTPAKLETIKFNNLGYKVKSKRLAQEKATIKNLIRTDLRRAINEPTQIFAEDLTSPIVNKTQAKVINRKLNQWMKGELQDSLVSVAKETGSVVTTVNPAYTSQVDSQTGTLLGQRSGDRFTRYTGVVLQADQNAALNIMHRGSDTEITRWMKYADVRRVLLLRTVRYLASDGKTVTEALNLGWLNSKFKTEALRLEASIT
ncbi:MAG: transposase [Moorea sp. SIO1F2]|nr:transposase [Moorena sp. SIO1F2]